MDSPLPHFCQPCGHPFHTYLFSFPPSALYLHDKTSVWRLKPLRIEENIRQCATEQLQQTIRVYRRQQQTRVGSRTFPPVGARPSEALGLTLGFGQTLSTLRLRKSHLIKKKNTTNIYQKCLNMIQKKKQKRCGEEWRICLLKGRFAKKYLITT